MTTVTATAMGQRQAHDEASVCKGHGSGMGGGAPPTAMAWLPLANVYARLWRFLVPHAEREVAKTREVAKPSPERRRRTSAVACRTQYEPLKTQQGRGSRQRSRATSDDPPDESPRAMQAKCINCGQRFFKDQGTCASSSRHRDYCSLDCRSTFEYLAAVQHSIDQHSAFADLASPLGRQRRPRCARDGDVDVDSASSFQHNGAIGA